MVKWHSSGIINLVFGYFFRIEQRERDGITITVLYNSANYFEEMLSMVVIVVVSRPYCFQEMELCLRCYAHYYPFVPGCNPYQKKQTAT